MAERAITTEERRDVHERLARARAAMQAAEPYDQARVDSMTSSMGCGVWGGNITNENISLKHYMNVTWVSRPIPEDRPSEAELFGQFYNSAIFEPLARTY